MPQWTVNEQATALPDRFELTEQLRAEKEYTHLLTESLADLELALEDKGWRSLSNNLAEEFSDSGRARIRTICRSMAISNPLIKRALNVRIGYIWGQGVEIHARARGDKAGQDVDAVVQDFLEDNTATLTGSQAHEELERALGTDGEVFLAAFTNPLTGRVQVRSTPTDEIVQIINNPEDRDEPWFYIREYVVQRLEAGLQPGNTRTRHERVKVAHPALGYRPNQRIKTLNSANVRWDAPILHVPVNRLDGMVHGIPDVYAAVAFARMYRDFLVDWAGLTKALSKFAWKATGDTRSRAANAAAKIRAASPTPGIGSGDAGQVAAMGPGNNLEAIPKSGAHIDANSGKPLAAMVAAGVGLPVTMLLADPGITGARATAETLDLPTVLEMTMRRVLWQGAHERLIQHAIDATIEAPRGLLRGSVTIDGWGRRQVTLANDVERTLEFDWPPLIDVDPVQFITAIVDADGTGKLPPLTTVRLLLKALGVKDIEDVLEEITDADGNWVDPRASAGGQASDDFRRGEDPASRME